MIHFDCSFVCISPSQIRLTAVATMLSICSAVSVDYFPHNHHADAGHLKYIEPAHVKSIKYVQPAPVLKHYAAAAPIPVHPHVKYIQPEPAPHVKYIHPEPAPHVKYIENPHHHHRHPYSNKYADYDDQEPAHYEYGYDVQDHQTGDFKSHSEKRDGHNVQGRYEVLDPDG